MSETPNPQATPGTPAELSTPAEPGALAEPVEAQAEELSAESLRIASELAEGYQLSPLDMVPNPSPLLVESTEEVAVPTPQGLFGLRAWRFADGAEHISARAFDRDGTPVPAEDGERPRYASTPNAPPAISSVPSDAIAAPSWRTACASLAAPAGTSSTCATTKDAASAWSTSSAPTRCRMPGSTPSTRTWRSAWTATCATTRRRR